MFADQHLVNINSSESTLSDIAERMSRFRRLTKSKRSILFCGGLILLLTAFITILFIYIVSKLREDTEYKWRKDEAKSLLNLEDKFLVPAMDMGCGGLGNMMWTFASLYGIAKKINRTPLYSSSTSCIIKAADEILHTFPEFGNRLHIFNIPTRKMELVKFGDHCCKYEDPTILIGKKAKFLEISGYYLQHYKFFFDVRNEIHKFFRFSKEIVTKVDYEAERMFGSDKSHKLCVYTRKGDFDYLNIGSTFEFTEPAMEFTYKNLQKRYENVSVVMLGEDKKFLCQIKQHMKVISRIYIPHEMSRGDDMCFGTRYCNSLLITASASTFGWWIGYLASVNFNETSTNKANQQLGSIFYNSNFQHMTPDTYSFSNYPTSWIPLRISNSSVYEDIIPSIFPNTSRDDFYAT